MTNIYIDDSIHERGSFIISGIIVTNDNIDKNISDSLKLNGYNPEFDEFKSGLNYRKHPNMLLVRNDLKNIISSSCKIGLIILPFNKRIDIGIETLRGIKRIIDSNNFENKIKIFIDENYFKNKSVGETLAKEIGLSDYEINLEVDSKDIKGIQLADLVAHTCSTMLLEQLGLICKKVKVGNNSGYDPNMDVELGFELWASIRYNLLGEVDEDRLNKGGDPIKKIEPFGLYISEYCDQELNKNAKERFSEIYLGCIH